MSSNWPTHPPTTLRQWSPPSIYQGTDPFFINPTFDQLSSFSHIGRGTHHSRLEVHIDVLPMLSIRLKDFMVDAYTTVLLDGLLPPLLRLTMGATVCHSPKVLNRFPV